jgi:hypothetical protein
MPGPNIVPGMYGMSGTRSSALAGGQLDEMAGFIASPVDTERGLAARLRYLTASPAGYAAMDAAGVTVTPRTLMGWLAESATPNAANLARIEDAYRAHRRRNVAEHLTRRLERGGRGTRVEIFPANHAGVIPGRRRPEVERHRHVNVRHWRGIVGSWADGDDDDLAGEWQDAVLEDMDSDWGAYEYAGGVGFWA